MIEPSTRCGGLTAPEKAFLRKVAWNTVEGAARGEALFDPLPEALKEGLDLEPRLLENRGAFVTLKSGGTLRGCIGYIEAIKPLVLAVAENGRRAAIRDPRFPPVEVGEIGFLTLQISALTPLTRVQSYDKIIPGRHGVHLARGQSQAVFLPQVAAEQGWNLQETLTQLARKAGLDDDSWRSDCEFRVFEAEVF